MTDKEYLATQYTVEQLDKEWEVVYHTESLTDAINKFRAYCLLDGDIQEYRLTTPERHIGN